MQRKPTLSADIQRRLGQAIARHYEQVLTEPLPANLAGLIEQLRAKVG